MDDRDLPSQLLRIPPCRVSARKRQCHLQYRTQRRPFRLSTANRKSGALRDGANERTDPVVHSAPPREQSAGDGA